MKARSVLRSFVALAALAPALASCSSSSDNKGPWVLAWSDDFDGTAVDTSKWKFDTGNEFGTQQQDFDTTRPENAAVTDGQLVLTARKEDYQGSSYTSARLESSATLSRTYGRFEARMQLPKGQGMWPAFWLLGNNFSDVGWPDCGEIDIMEMRGADPTSIAGSMHGPGGGDYTAGYRLPGGASFSDDFHVFAVEWEAGVIRWYVDGSLYQTRSSDLLPRNQKWVFDHPFFIILDLAVGGMYGGPTDASTTFPQTVRVDYVRVYTR
jgi:beta-glucanase (GH16 family)